MESKNLSQQLPTQEHLTVEIINKSTEEVFTTSALSIIQFVDSSTKEFDLSNLLWRYCNEK